MPGLLLSEAALTGRMTDDSAALVADMLVDRICDGVADTSRVERFRKAWHRAAAIATANRSGACPAFPYDEFWSHSLVCALAAHALSAQLDWGAPEEAFLCGFLHRMGALALACGFPFEYAELMELRSLDDLEELRSVEQDLFGLDHLQATHAVLSDLELPDALLETLLSLSDVRRSFRSPLERLVLAGERIANLCLREEGQRPELWLDLVDLRQELGLERDEFTAMGDAVIRQWWEWGDQLKIRTRVLPSFLALDQTGLIDRAALGLTRIVSAHPAGSPLRVLVVDDERMALKILERQLVIGGYDVLTAVNGADALAATLEHSPDVVVADWMMPEMDGLELCRRLRRFEAGRQVFFVLLTGRDEEADVVEAFEAEVDDFMPKPAKQEVLLARMRAARRVLELREQHEEDQRLLKQQLARTAALARQAKDAAVTDALTELHNRRYATKRLAEEWAYAIRTGRPLSIVMMDVDRFKDVNDTYGHDVGDQVLQRVASVLRDTTRKGEVACRFGGEEFLVICRNTSEEEARLCGERIRAAVEELVVQGVPFDRPITVSVGVATRGETTEDSEALVRSADLAVYQAKDLGRNRVCFEAPPAPLPAPRGPSSGTEAGTGGKDGKDWAQAAPPDELEGGSSSQDRGGPE